MIDDLLTQLVVAEVQRATDRTVPRDEAQLRLEAIEDGLAPRAGQPGEGVGECSREELHFLAQYLRLGLPELDAISSAAHAWILERFCMSPWTLEEGGVGQLTHLYFLRADPSVRTVTVLALLALDSAVPPGEREGPPSSLTPVWNGIVTDGQLAPDQKREMLAELADLLIDLIDPEQPAALNALTELLRATSTYSGLDQEGQVRRHVAARAADFGGDLGERLRERAGD
jgi:hypothetical protein